MPVTTYAGTSALFDACPLLVPDTHGYLGTVGTMVEFRTLMSAIRPSSYAINEATGVITLTPGNPGGTPITFGPFGTSELSVANGILTHNTGLPGAADQTFSVGYTDNGNGTYTPGGTDPIDTRANSNPYAPAVAGNWDATAPALVSEALDEVAARQKQVVNSGTAVPVTEITDGGAQQLVNGNNIDEELESNGIIRRISADGQRQSLLRRVYARMSGPEKSVPPNTMTQMDIFGIVPSSRNIGTAAGPLALQTVLISGMYQLDVIATDTTTSPSLQGPSPNIYVGIYIDGALRIWDREFFNVNEDGSTEHHVSASVALYINAGSTVHIEVMHNATNGNQGMKMVDFSIYRISR